MPGENNSGGGDRRNNVSEAINLSTSLTCAGNTKKNSKVHIREWCK